MAAEEQYRRALRIAAKQEAELWDLYAAVSLAGLLRDQGKRTEGRDLLAPIYGWFTEGLGTPGLKDAEALLGELTQVGDCRRGRIMMFVASRAGSRTDSPSWRSRARDGWRLADPRPVSNRRSRPEATGVPAPATAGLRIARRLIPENAMSHRGHAAVEPLVVDTCGGSRWAVTSTMDGNSRARAALTASLH